MGVVGRRSLELKMAGKTGGEEKDENDPVHKSDWTHPGNVWVGGSGKPNSERDKGVKRKVLRRKTKTPNKKGSAEYEMIAGWGLTRKGKRGASSVKRGGRWG